MIKINSSEYDSFCPPIILLSRRFAYVTKISYICRLNYLITDCLISEATLHEISIIMDEELRKKLAADPDGLLTYEYIANHIGDCNDIMVDLVDNIINVDKTGQFTVSAARYLNAIDSELYAPNISTLIAAAIEKDHERRYIGDLLTGIWGQDYESRAEVLKVTDDNFRRIYKRLYPAAGI